MGRHAASARQRHARFRIALIVGLVVLVGGGTAAAVTVTRGEHAAGRSSACPNGTVSLVVRADPSATGWLGTLARRYAAQHHLIDGHCVVPAVSTLAFNDASAVVRSTPYPGGGAAPDVWVPDSIAAYNVLDQQVDNAEVLPNSAIPIATSPLVLAGPAQTVNAWHKDGASQDLDALLSDADNSTSRIAMPDPGSSGAGLATLLAAVGKSSNDTVNGDSFSESSTQLSLLRLRARQFDTAVDGSALLTKVAGQASADHLVAVSEHDVWQYDKSHPTSQLASFDAFGTVRASDYPYVVLNASWVTDRIRRAAQDFQGWLTGTTAQNSLASFGLRQTDGSAGALSGPGTDGAHGRLGSAAESGSVAAAHSAWTLLTTNRSVLSLIDVSGSMSDRVPGTAKTKLDLARETAANALPYFTTNDSVGLSEFSALIDGGGSYRELVPLASMDGAGKQANALRSAYQQLKPVNGTALYDAVLQAYKAAQQSYQADTVNVVVVLSDGDDANSTIDLKTLLDKLKAVQDASRPVHIVTIAYGADADTGVLKQIAAATDGESFAAPDPRSIGTVYISALAAITQ